MNRQSIEKLLGGYSAGILTPEEERTLFEAALEDQALFDALVREQPLRELLEDPAARASLLAALADRPLPWYRRLAGWAIEPKVLASLAAVMCVALTLTVWQAKQHKSQPVLTAQTAPTAPGPAPAPMVLRDAVPPPPAPKAQAAAPMKRKPEMKVPLETAAKAPVPRAETPPAGLKPGARDEATAGAAGVAGAVAGVPQMQAPAPRRPAVADQVLPAPPPAASPAPPPATSQQVQVFAQAVLLAPASPLQWSLLRRQPDGELAAAAAGELQAGDAVTLRLNSKQAGYVYVVEKEKLLASSRIETGKPFDAAIEPEGSGRRDLQLWFSPYPMTWPATGKGRLEMSRMSTGAQAVGGAQPPNDANAPAGGSSPATRPVSVAITLNYR